MTIAIGCDHAGYHMKQAIMEMLAHEKHIVADLGTYSEERADYPDYALQVSNHVADAKSSMGILICGSGIGVSIVANKVKGIRAANCVSNEMATLARAHNNANVLCLGARLLSSFEALEIVRTFLSTDFEGGRHTLRVDKIHSLSGR